MHPVQDQKILRGERNIQFPAYFFEKQDKCRVLDLSLKRKVHLVAVCSCEIRREFTTADGFFKNEVHALPGTFHEPALGEEVGYAAVTRVLTVQYVLQGNARWKTARTFYLKVSRVLTYKHASTKAVIPVTHRIENGFPDGSFFEGGDVLYEQPILVMLEVITEIYCIPEIIIEGKERFPVFLALLGRAGSF